MKIVTFTEGRTASTLVSNIITGFFEHNLPIEFISKQSYSIDKIIDSTRITIKTHGSLKNVSVFNQINEFLEQQYSEIIYIVYINRYVYHKDNHPQIIILDYKNLLYRSNYNLESNLTLRDVIEYVASACERKNITINEEMIRSAEDRIIKMDELYEKIKNEPFEYYDEFYHLHGSHRNRPK